MPPTADEVFRDFVVDGDPSTGVHNPRKYDLREWGKSLEAATSSASAAAALAADAAKSFVPPVENRVPFGTFVGGDPWLRTPAQIVGLTQPEVAGLVYPRGIRWPVGQSEFAIWRSLADGVLGKYVFGAVIVISANPANLPAAATVYQENASGTLTALTSATTGYADLAPAIRLIWRTGRAQASGTRNTMVGAAEAPVDDTRFATGFYLLTSDAPVSYTHLTLPTICSV